MTTNRDMKDSTLVSDGMDAPDPAKYPYDAADAQTDDGPEGDGRPRFRMRRKGGDGKQPGAADEREDARQPGLPEASGASRSSDGPPTSPLGLQRAARRTFEQRRALAVASPASDEWKEIAAGLEQLGMAVTGRPTRGAIITREVVINDENLRMLFVATMASAMQGLPLIVRTGMFVRATQKIAEEQIPLLDESFRHLETSISEVEREVDARLQESGITAQDVEQSFYRKAPLRSRLPIMCGHQNRLVTSLQMADRILRAADVMFALDAADLKECKRWREMLLDPMRQLSTTIYKGMKLIYRATNMAPPVRQRKGAAPALASAQVGPASPARAEPAAAAAANAAITAPGAGLKVVASAPSSPAEAAGGQENRRTPAAPGRARA